MSRDISLLTKPLRIMLQAAMANGISREEVASSLLGDLRYVLDRLWDPSQAVISRNVCEPRVDDRTALATFVCLALGRRDPDRLEFTDVEAESLYAAAQATLSEGRHP